MIEVVNDEFNVATLLRDKRLQDLSDSQREVLKIARARHSSVAWQHGFEDAATAPTRVMPPGSPEYEKAISKEMERRELVKRQGDFQQAPAIGSKFIPGKGYVVESEDINVLLSRDVDPAEAIKICSVVPPKPVSQEKVRRAEMATKGPVVRDAENRFKKL